MIDNLKKSKAEAIILQEKYDTEAERDLKKRADPANIPKKGDRGKTLQQYLNNMIYSGDVEKEKKEIENFKICGCGEKNPKFSAGNGIWFCETCL